MKPFSFVDQFPLYERFGDPGFLERAYADYLDRKNAQYQKVQCVLSAADDYDEEIHGTVSDYVTQLISEQSLMPDALIPAEQGYIPLYKLAQIIATAAENDELNPTITLSNGVTADAVTAGLCDVVQGIIDQSMATSCLSAALRATVESSEPAGRMTLFKQHLDNVYSTVATSTCTAAAYYSDLLSTGTSGLELINASIDGMANDVLASETPAPVGQCDLSQFTGASPAGPINFGSPMSAIGTVVNVGAKVVSGIGKLCGKLIKKGWKKVKKAVTEIISNPDDLAYLTDSGNDTVDGLKWADIMDEDVYMQALVSFIQPQAQVTIRDALAKAVEDYNSNPYHAVMTPFGIFETTSLISGQWDVINSYNGYLRLTLQGDGTTDDPNTYFNFSPRVVNPKVVEAYFNTEGALQLGNNSEDIDNFEALCSDVQLHDTKQLTEADKFKGLIYGWLLSIVHLQMCANAWRNEGLADTFHYYAVRKVPSSVTSTVTNKRFASLASGLVDDSILEYLVTELKAYDTWYSASPMITSLTGINYLKEVLRSTAMCAVTGIMAERIDSHIYPTDFGFIPYTHDQNKLLTPTWRVKTDAENKDAFQLAIKAAIIIVAVVAVAVTGAVVMKKISTKRAWKRERTIAETQAKMWNGEPLTKKEMKKYKKALKKGGVSSLFDKASGGLNIDSGENQTYNINALYLATTGSKLPDEG